MRKTLARHKCIGIVHKDIIIKRKIYHGFSLVGRSRQRGSKTLRKHVRINEKIMTNGIGEHHIGHRNYKLSLEITRDKCVKRFYVCAYFATSQCAIPLDITKNK